MIFIGGVVLTIMQLCSVEVLAEFKSSEQLQNNLTKSPGFLRAHSETFNNNEVDQKIDSLARDINTFTANLSFTDKICKSLSKGCLKPPSQNNRLKALEGEIRNMKEIIEKLKKSSNIDKNTKERLRNLVEQVARLQKILDNANKEVWTATEEFEKLMEDLTSQVNDYRKKLDGVEKFFKEKEEEERQRRLRAQIIDDIKSRNYLKALERLQQLGGELKANINFIVHEVYNNQEGNFDLILQFGDASKNTTVSLAIYQALIFKMESNGHNDYERILKLMNSLKRNIIDKKTPEAREAQKLVKSLQSLVESITAPLLKNGLINKNRETVSQISDRICSYYSEMMISAYSHAIKEMSTTELEKTTFYFVGHEHRVQRIFGYSAIFNELRKRCSLQPTEVLNRLIYSLEAALNFSDQSTMNDAKYYLQNGIPDLPVSKNSPTKPDDLVCQKIL